MDNCLFVFLSGFLTCAIGAFIALMFDVGMDCLSSWFKQFF